MKSYTNDFIVRVLAGGIKPLCLFILLMALNLNTLAQFAGGNGTENNPYLIANVTQLQAIRNAPNSAHFKLINDIDASATATWNSGQGFNPIGYFNGTIEGDNFSIIDLTINRLGLYNCGLITQTGAMAVIQNLNFVNATIRGGDRTGLIAGTLGGTVSAVTASGTVQGSSRVGGIAGQMDGGSSVLNSSFSINISGSGNYVGGITGLLNSNTVLTNVSNTGNVTGQERVGGVTGQANSNTIITNAVIVGDVTGTGDYVGGLVGYCQNIINGGSFSGDVSGQKYVGGATGRLEGTLTGLTINGSVTGSSDYIGGLVGWNNNGTITNCSTSGSVSGAKEVGGLVGWHSYSNGVITLCNSSMVVNGIENIGGLVGQNQDGLIELSYSTGSVNGITNSGGLVGNSRWGNALIRLCFSLSSVNPGGTGGNYNQTGGLVGNLTSGRVENSFARGSITGNNRVGGLIGQMESNATVLNSYSTGQVNGSAGQTGGLIGRRQSGEVIESFWDRQTSGQTSSAGGMSRTTAQMLQQSLYSSAGWNFNTIWSMDPAINDGYPYLQAIPGAFLFVWTGNIDTEWEKTGNWSLNRLPVSTDNIIIPNVINKPLLSSNATVRGISIQPNSTLTIAPAGSLSVLQTFTNSAGTQGLIFISNNNGTGSLIHPSAGVAATFQRYIPGAPEAWHMLASPMAAQPISPAFTPPGTYGDSTGYDLYHWHEPDTSWIYYNHPSIWNSTHGSLNFIPARGYLVAYQDTNPTKTFAGILNQGNISIALTKTAGLADEFGFNLAGNPYPSSIDWKAASGWGRTPLEQSAGGYNLWIWNDTAYNYGVYNSATAGDWGTLGTGRYIAPTQGFFVRAAQSGSISFSNDIRAHNNSGHWFKNQQGAGEAEAAMTLTLSSQLPLKGADEVQILFGYPEDGGALKKFSFMRSAPSLFIPAQNQSWSVRMLESTAKHPVIPVSFIPPADGQFTLTASFDLTFFQTAILEDLQTGHTVNLMQKPGYTFVGSTRDDPARFVLRLQEGAFPNPHDELPVLIYAYQKALTIDLRFLTPGQDYKVSVITIDGKLAAVYSLAGGNLVTLNQEQLRAGIYIVAVAGPEGVKREKVCL